MPSQVPVQSSIHHISILALSDASQLIVALHVLPRICKALFCVPVRGVAEVALIDMPWSILSHAHPYSLPSHTIPQQDDEDFLPSCGGHAGRARIRLYPPNLPSLQQPRRQQIREPPYCSLHDGRPPSVHRRQLEGEP